MSTPVDTDPARTVSPTAAGSPRPSGSSPRRTRPQRRFVAVAVLAVVAVAAGLFGPTLWSTVTGGSLSVKDRIAAAPPPTLFPDAQTAATAADVASQRGPAATLLRTWVTAHGTGSDDAAFVTWLEGAFPAPPATLGAEMTSVARLAATRTRSGVAASTWLETFGKKDIWKLYEHDQAELLTPAAGQARKSEEKKALAMSKQVADALGARFGSSAPYVRRPSLRPDHTVAPGATCPCSYPSRHATASAASETVLGALMPQRDADYRAMEAQVDYSRVYMAGHFPSDIRAGALLGDVIGDYFLVTSNHTDPAQLPG